jgi:hypothetical protein
MIKMAPEVCGEMTNSRDGRGGWVPSGERESESLPHSHTVRWSRRARLTLRSDNYQEEKSKTKLHKTHCKTRRMADQEAQNQ